MMWKKKKRCLICVTIERNWLLHSGPSIQLLVHPPNNKKSAGLWRLLHVEKVHFKSSWESNHGEGSQSVSSLLTRLEDGVCLHGLLVMPLVCLVNPYIKPILFAACLVVLLHFHGWTLLSDVVPLKKWPWSLHTVLISSLHHLLPLMSSASFLLCTELFWKLIWNLRL